VNRKELGARLRELRTRRKLTQEELGQASDLSADSIRKLEHGGFSPTFDTLNKLADGFDLHVIHLLTDDFDEADDLAALIRGLPNTERILALTVLGSLCAHVATNRRRNAAP
jgi:transcriptional regulator with XRE-family HTH domain